MLQQTPKKAAGRWNLLIIPLVGLLFLVTSVGLADAHSVRHHHHYDDGLGFYLGLTLTGSSLHADNDDDPLFIVKDDGGGLNLKLGYHITPTFAMELALGAAAHETIIPTIDAAFGAVQIFALYRFSPDQPFRPYIKGGFGGYALVLEEGAVDATLEGGGIAFGGGFDYFFNPHFSLGLDFTHNVIRYDELTWSAGAFSVDWEIAEDGAQSSLGLALTYYF